MRYDTKIQSREINPDGTMSLFVVLDSQETDLLRLVSTEPELDIVGYEPHFKDGKLFSLTLRVKTWPKLVEGSPLIIILGNQ